MIYIFAIEKPPNNYGEFYNPSQAENAEQKPIIKRAKGKRKPTFDQLHTTCNQKHKEENIYIYIYIPTQGTKVKGTSKTHTDTA